MHSNKWKEKFAETNFKTEILFIPARQRHSRPTDVIRGRRVLPY